MISDGEYIDFVMEKFASLESVSTKRMFGGNVIHMAGRVMGFVFDGEFLFEPGPAIDSLMPDAERKELFPGSKLFVVIDESVSASRLCDIARACYDDFPVSKPRRRKGKDHGTGAEPDEEVLKRFPFAIHIKD